MLWVAEAFAAQVEHRELERVPFVIWNKGPFIPWFVGCDVYEYYTVPEINLKAQLELQEMYPGALLWPSIWPDLGPVVEASAFGGEIRYFADSSPFAMPAFASIEEVRDLEMPDPHRDGMMPQYLEHWKFLWENLDPYYIEEYGYLRGWASTFGPIELAGQVLGYDRLFMALYDAPELVAEFLERITEMLIAWLEAQEEINGRLRYISITDHTAGQISAEHFDRFYQPYIRMLCDAFPGANKLYHNESDLHHVLERIPDLGAEIFHFGVEVERAKESIGDRVCLMGAVHSQDYLLNSTPEEVYSEAARQIRIGGRGGGYVLSVRGGFQPGTARENMDAMARAARNVLVK